MLVTLFHISHIISDAMQQWALVTNLPTKRRKNKCKTENSKWTATHPHGQNVNAKRNPRENVKLCWFGAYFCICRATFNLLWIWFFFFFMCFVNENHYMVNGHTQSMRMNANNNKINPINWWKDRQRKKKWRKIIQTNRITVSSSYLLIDLLPNWDMRSNRIDRLKYGIQRIHHLILKMIETICGLCVSDALAIPSNWKKIQNANDVERYASMCWQRFCFVSMQPHESENDDKINGTLKHTPRLSR